MDNTSRRLLANHASNVSNYQSKVSDGRVVYSTIAAQRLDSLGLSSSYFSNSKGSKRKCGINIGSVNLQDASSLLLGLGCSASSCTTISAGKEIEESSVDLGLSNNLHLRNERTSKQMYVSCGTPNGLRTEKPKLDLELSLSTARPDSDITTVTQGFFPIQNNAESPVVDGEVQLVDEGSTSSKWKLRRPLVPPLHISQSTESTVPIDHPHRRIDPTPVAPNLSPAAAITTKSSVACASVITHQQQRRHTSLKTCIFNGCTRGARGASGLCIAHGGGRRCQRPGCDKGAEGKTVFCKAHGGGRRCQYLGCTKSAEGRTDYCIGHGGGRRCSQEGCTRAARGKSGVCIRHGGGKRCKMENCGKSAEGISGLCISHGGGRRCQYPNCTKGAQGSTMFCKAHGGGKRCTFLGCGKGAEGSTPFCKGHGGGKRCSFEGGCTKSVHGGTLFCVNHGGGKRCAAPYCSKSARGRTNFCVRHGGGKRCKFEGCGKSAQGSTDFCKAHGGGKRCSWSQAGVPCDKFARGKSGLCAAHSTQVPDKQIHGDSAFVHTLDVPHSSTLEKMKGKSCAIGNETAGSFSTAINVMGYGNLLIPGHVPFQENMTVRNGLVPFSLPEGRVHGGNLMAMLRGGTSFGASSSNQVVGGPPEPGKSYPMPHSWV
ncbi:uncharacterized protein LOC130767511 [Actinidia eriantha]|uniref:uncharacterized protein LOC130767511 n=1 Tax=Actinidia eriantha TaxID=165200 RepID=UPI002589AE68|nr:uncharacterized protein LOC130767511 [Actinidia eriantha]